ncbi:hypothetical protein SAMN05216228_106916 [Rhizobium tibeticum]|uniref:Uncharacterized protein n=1 Tax=Rhizobium tibeticum TaxID=501024 RepID=A0A1H8WLQ7_9HYPH|nr:hypothetical protein [Rhizobium tibeticum]SEI21257.1 hypothetical protein RTCCBAU85039_6579 [Rhizobium tibeticum]SEP28529.1 hypothetical protein SAMN05216228_106916 [Rhizobium tibeticum]
MKTQRPIKRRRALRGVAYSLTEFPQKYGLGPAIAEDLFIRFGPSAVDLDLLMAAKQQKPSITALTRDIARWSSVS